MKFSSLAKVFFLLTLCTLVFPSQSTNARAAGYTFTTSMGVGSSGSQVTALQNILITDHYLLAPSATGYYGVLTQVAVKEYQVANKIEDTGYVGPLTIAALNGTSSTSGTSLIAMLTAELNTLEAELAAILKTPPVQNQGTIPQPTCFLSASPTQMSSGETSTLTWQTQNATSLSIDNDIGTEISTGQGSVTVTPTVTTTYTATASNSDGSVNCQATVTVAGTTPPPPQAPQCSIFSASPTQITSGGSSTLSWSTQNTTSISIDNGVGVVTPIASGSVVVSPSTNTTYTATLTNATGQSTTCQTSVQVSQPPPPPYLPADTWNGIFPGIAFNSHITNLNDEIGKFFIVWGASSPAPSGIYNSYYYPFDRDRFTTNLSWLMANHPDWIEYSCAAGNYSSQSAVPSADIAYEFGDANVPLDITNPDVLNYMLTTYITPAIQKGYQAIAFDNLGLANDGRCGVWKSGKWDQEFSGSEYNDQTYINSILNWASFMYSHIHALGAGVVMNYRYQFGTTNTNDIYDMLNYMDVDLPEGGINDLGNNSIANWTTDTMFNQKVQNLGKGQFVLDYVDEPNYSYNNTNSQSQVQWALANYLLTKEHHSYIAIENPTTQDGQLIERPEYASAIGTPLSLTFAQNQNVYVRLYTNGEAIVNPDPTNSFTVTLPANTYVDQYGNTMGTSLVMQPQSGIVLLKK